MSAAARRRMARRALGAAGALVLDRVAGEPPVPDALHPVAVLGRGIAALEGRIYDDRRAPGAVLTAAGVGAAGAAGAILRSPAAAGYVATSGRALHEAATAVSDALAAGDLPAARDRLTHLVGRDPSDLDEAAIARAVVESVAENTTDAVVAPALWTAAAGAVGAFVHRAADTLDSMVGYRDARYQRFGTAAAHLDDVLAWGPARATAVLVAAAAPRRPGRCGAPSAPTPGATPPPTRGWPRPRSPPPSACASAAARTATATWCERRPELGDGRAPGPADIAAAVSLSRDVTWALAALLAAAGATLLLTARRRRAHRHRAAVVEARREPAGRCRRPGSTAGDGARVAAALGLRPDQVLDLSASLNPAAPDVAALAAPHLDALGPLSRRRRRRGDPGRRARPAGRPAGAHRRGRPGHRARRRPPRRRPGRRARVLALPPPPAPARRRRTTLAVRPPQPVGAAGRARRRGRRLGRGVPAVGGRHVDPRVGPGGRWAR